MKKVLAIVLALVMALSMSAMAFAADEAAEVEAILNEIVEVAESDVAADAWASVEGAIIKVIDAVEAKADEAAVNGEVVNLETLLDKIPGTDGLLDSLKETIKGLYAGEIATVPATEAEKVAETGSASVGIAVFAAVSVAAAAAYVCTKKN